ncbi:MAG: AgmX/PglI C-terminal domain-containing protein, partial [Archangium sp.]|nr:AgmX/PglI C-terminal domain-containing protein [Archangium sp.]
MSAHLVEELLLQYRFGTLDAQASANVAEHLRTCSECTRAFARLGDSLERLSEYDVEANADATLDRALERATAALELSRRAERKSAPIVAAPAAVPAAPPSSEAAPIVPTPAPAGIDFWAWLGVSPGAGGRPFRLAMTSLLALSTLWVAGGALYWDGISPPLETRVRGEASLEAGGHGLINLEVRRGEQGVPETPFSVSLVTATGRVLLQEGRTDSEGNAAVALSLPYLADPSPQLEVKTRAGVDEDVVQVPLKLQQSFRVHLSTDKPLYQPGQTMHLRSLVLRTPRPEPASGKSVVFEVRDARDARIAQKTVQVSPFGIASFDLELSDEVALGTWKLSATVDGTVADAQVEVSRYTLPKFKLAIAPRKQSYLAGERLEARVTARYFFGQPVVGASLRGVVMLGDGAVLSEVKGKTDADGTWKLQAELPAKLAAVQPEPVFIKVEAIDAAGQQEQSEHPITVSRDLLSIVVVADGAAVGGTENSYFVFTTTPDGQPVPCDVEVQRVQPAAPTVGSLLRGLSVLRPAVLPVSTRTIGVQGALPREAAVSVINAHLGELTSCYARAQRVTPLLAGKLVLQIDLAPNGNVSAARTKASSLQSPALEACALASVKTWRFPAKAGVITVPFLFSGALPPTPPSPPPAPEPSADLIGDPVRARTSENGLGQFKMATPAGSVTFRVKAEDADGRKATREVSLWDTSALALSADKAFYRPGEPIRAELRSGGPVNAEIVEARSQGRLIARARITKVDNDSIASLLPPRDFVGPLDLGLEGGLPLRRVMVAEPSSLVVKLSTDKPSYRPGEPATVRFTVTDAQGKPKVAALGLSVVDESLFALTSDKPEVVRAFFLVERALLQTRFGSNVGALLAANSWTDEQQRLGRLLLSFAAKEPSPALATSYLQSTLEPKLIERHAQRRLWAQSAGVLGALAVFILVCAVVIALATRFTPVAGGAVLGVAALGAAFLRLPWQVQVFGALIISFAAMTVSRTKGKSEVASSLFFLPLLCVAFGLFTWSPLRFEPPDEPMVTSSAWPPVGTTAVAPMPPTPKPSPKLPMKPAEKKSEVAKGTAAGLGALKAMTADLSLLGAKAPAPVEEPPRREVRVRQHFPETLYVNPQLIADERGVAEFTLPLADSITAWRISALASSADGKLGTLDAPLKVFQPFFVDLDVPVALVRGDEATIPVALYNYLDTPQDLRLEVEKAPWFELVGDAPAKVSIAPNGVEGRALRIRVLQAGEHQLNVRADGSTESDVVAREILVTEGGREETVTVSGTLRAGKPSRVALEVPEAAVGATPVLVRLAPSLAAAALEGIEGTLQQPTGCFEQTSAATYSDLLVEEFLRREGRLTEELERRSTRLLSLGYQRLVGFEVAGGGFEWFGRSPSNQLLTALALMEFSDLRRAISVEPALIERTQRALLSRQQTDGSWNIDAQVLAEGLWRSEHKGRVTVTAYIAWALAESGLRNAELERAQRFLSENLESTDDAYALALITAGFARTAHPEAAKAAAQLARKAQRVDGLVSFKPASATAFYGRGTAGEVETTALAAYALAKSGVEPGLMKGALDFLLARRSRHGAWPSTQGTILALKALLAGTDTRGVPTVNVTINGTPAGKFALSGGAVKVLQLGDRAKHGLNVIELSSDLDAPFLATATYTLPWRQAGQDDGKPLALSVEY